MRLNMEFVPDPLDVKPNMVFVNCNAILKSGIFRVLEQAGAKCFKLGDCGPTDAAVVYFSDFRDASSPAIGSFTRDS